MAGLFALPGPAHADEDAVRALVKRAAKLPSSTEGRVQMLKISEQVRAMGLPAVAPLLELLKDPTPDVRRASAALLGKLGLMVTDNEQVARPLIAVLESDDDVWSRVNAANALGMTRNQLAVPALIAALDDEEVWMRRIAVGALISLNNGQAITPLAMRFEEEADPSVRSNIIRALGNLGALKELQALSGAVTDSKQKAELKRALHRAKNADPNFSNKIVQNMKKVQGRQVAEKERNLRDTLRFSFLIEARGAIQTLAYLLLALPVIILGFLSLSRTPPGGRSARVWLLVIGGGITLLLGALASLPVAALTQVYIDMAGDVPLDKTLAWTFTMALGAVPMVLCSLMVRVDVAGAGRKALVNAAFWAGSYMGLQFVTWRAIPALSLWIRGDEFQYGSHPGWHLGQGLTTLCVLLAAATAGMWLANLTDRRAECNTYMDSVSVREFITLAAPCLLSSGLGFLILNFYLFIEPFQF